MITQALVVDSPGDPFVLQDVELDDHLHEDEVQVRIKATGITHTDLDFSHEETMPELFPGILGHEGAGVVERIGSGVTMVEVGDHVVCTYSSCGECDFCLRRDTAFCDLWFQYNLGVGRLDGSKAFRSRKTGKRIASHFFGQSSFARCTVLKETGCVKVPKDLPLHIAAPLGYGFMTGAGAMLNVVQPEHDMAVVVVGVGPVGLAAIMACKLLEHPPRRIIAVDIVPSRLELARRFGATHGVNSKLRKDLMQVLMDITNGAGVNGAIDTTGKPDILQNLVHSSARQSRVVSVGVRQWDTEVSLNIFEMVNAGCSFIGCNAGNCYPQELIPQLIEANRMELFPFDQLITTYPAQNVAKAVEDLKSGRTLKAVLKW